MTVDDHEGGEDGADADVALARFAWMSPEEVEAAMEVEAGPERIGAGLRENLPMMTDDQIRAVIIHQARRIGSPWWRVARTLRRTVAEVREIEQDHPWPYPELSGPG